MFFLPISSLVVFLVLLISAYLTVTQYDSGLPIYIFALFPALIVITSIATTIAYVEWAYIHISSLAAMSELCCSNDSAWPEKGSRGQFSNYFQTRVQIVVDSVTKKSVKRHHVVTILRLYKRHKLFPVRPIRMEAGDFGHYMKIGAAVKLISDVLSYLIIILRLREFRLSEIS